jgi:hypothetical protein
LEETLKSIPILLLVLLRLLSVSAAQNSPARTDVCHVHFVAAAPGKAVQLADSFKTPLPNDPMPGHTIVLRHNYGDAWDYVVIQHMGTKATVEATPSAIPSSVRDLYAWHNDTYANGPSWAEFTRAMGVGDQASKTSGSEYVVSVYRAVPAHRDQLKKCSALRLDPERPATSSCSIWKVDPGTIFPLFDLAPGMISPPARPTMRHRCPKTRGPGSTCVITPAFTTTPLPIALSLD